MKLKDVKRIFPEATDDQIQQMLDLVHTETDALRDEVDRVKRNADPEGWKKKHDDLRTEYDQYKADQQKKESDEAKRSAIKDLLQDSFSEKGLVKVIKYADLDSIELTDKGTIRDASKLLAGMKEEWSEFVTTTETEGVETHGRDGAGSAGGNGSGGKAMTREEIMKIDDAGERQKAMAEHHDLFGF